ncbi:FliC/FljB family flagellin [Cobetia sp. 1CM21F]|uniref:FliC/FljB family flagellin n=1 Tax=Cobetia sp. 1CM21F TaxID=2929163 RepID=UPI0020BF2DC7|nr:FliC/FljB family flagellin [Cobetia sp. 1CM21F]MCK8067302.1 FliC/FljB family flagellin [Cobetia sp. 1CM21F]
MASVINTNTLSMVTQQNLNQSQNALNTSMERLSSGLRINSAKDDAAGQAIANRMDSQITGLSQAQRNANDGISVAQTAEGAANQVNDNLQRIRELTVQAANGTNSSEDLESIQNEIGMRLDEIDRISEETSFNGTNVLAEDQSIEIQVGSEDGQTIEIDLKQLNRDTLGLGSFDVTKMLNTEDLKADDGTAVSTSVTPVINADSGGAETAEGLYTDGTNYLVKDGNGDYFTATDNGDGTFDWDSSSTTAYADDAAASADGYDTTTAVSEVDAELDVSGAIATGDTLMEKVDSDGNGTGEYVIKSQDSDGNDVYNAATINADATITKGETLTDDPLATLDNALSDVDDLRSDLGALQNRFDSAITNLATTETNLASAQSRIQDADYAEEVSSMTTAQILQQAGTSMLTQANQVPQNVLSLLG